MFGRLRRPGERGLKRTTEGGAGSLRSMDEAARYRGPAQLEALANELQRLGAEAPAIDEQRVWLRVQAGMRAEPQRRSGMPRFALPGTLLVAAPRLAFAGALAIALLLGALVGTLLLQSRASVSAAFLDEMQRMAQASEVAATRGPLSADDSAALEERALGLLQLASRPEVLADLGPTEAELAHQRLLEARSALAGVVGENPGDTRALAALAAISGFLAPALNGSPPSASTPVDNAGSTATAAATSTAIAHLTPTASATANAALTATAEPTAPARSENATRTPEGKVDGSQNRESPSAAPSADSTAASAVSTAQRACAQAYDLASLAWCTTASATAVAACTQARSGNGCQAGAEAAVNAAQQRVQRVGDDCQRLPSSKTRNACSEATNRARENSGSGNRGSGNQNDGRNGGGERNNSDARGRRD